MIFTHVICIFLVIKVLLAIFSTNKIRVNIHVHVHVHVYKWLKSYQILIKLYSSIATYMYSTCSSSGLQLWYKWIHLQGFIQWGGGVMWDHLPLYFRPNLLQHVTTSQYKLSWAMEATSKVLNLKHFLGEHSPDPPPGAVWFASSVVSPPYCMKP